jgi:hypothetical protein
MTRYPGDTSLAGITLTREDGERAEGGRA